MIVSQEDQNSLSDNDCLTRGSEQLSDYDCHKRIRHAHQIMIFSQDDQNS